FTARVQAHPHVRQAPVRQQMYLRALGTLPDVEIFYGQFSYHKVRMPRADGQGTAEVVKAEEKGSDVALAVHALHDAHTNQYDVAVIISNDSDIVPALDIIRNGLGKQVHVLFPTCSKRKRWPCHDLKCASDGHKEIRNWALRQAQFDNSLTDAIGTFHKPECW
ncbi:MAG: NYN domain-containing protein, partial [Armatimonadia bacterium]